MLGSMKNTMNKVRDFLRWESLLCEEQKEQLKRVECPAKMWGKPVPSLNELTLEELAQLWDVTNTPALFYAIGRILFGKGERAVNRADTLAFVGVVNRVAEEVQRINALWEAIPTYHSPEEVQAGCNALKFGIFGIADWYARRMGMHDHDEAFATKWMRIYQCMRNDAEEAAYRRRLNDIIVNKSKR